LQCERGGPQEKEHDREAERVVVPAQVSDDGADKNRTRPPAAAIPTADTPIPISNPSAPAAFKIPSVVIHDFDTPTFAMLMRIGL